MRTKQPRTCGSKMPFISPFLRVLTPPNPPLLFITSIFLGSAPPQPPKLSPVYTPRVSLASSELTDRNKTRLTHDSPLSTNPWESRALTPSTV
jgi:hypothetical protein